MATPPTPTIEVYYDGGTPTDISGYVNTIQITRGRTSPFEDMQAGTCTLQAYNNDRSLDAPIYLAGGNPLSRLKVTAASESLFDGDIENYAPSYPAGRVALTTITAVDLMARVARVPVITTQNGAGGEYAGDRILSVLTLIGMNTDADLSAWDTGISTLQQDLIPATTNALQYINLVGRTEQGRFFASRSRLLNFKDGDYQSETPVLTIADTFAGGTIPFSFVEAPYGPAYSQVVVSRVGGSTETFTDDGVSAVYGIISTESLFTGLLYADDAQSELAGLGMIAVLADTGQRFSRFVINLGRLTSAEQTSVLQLELGMLIRGIFTPAGVGSALDQNVIIEGIRHTIAPRSHVVELLVSLGLS